MLNETLISELHSKTGKTYGVSILILTDHIVTVYYSEYFGSNHPRIQELNRSVFVAAINAGILKLKY